MFKHILVAVDFSEHSREALQLAARLAEESGAHLSVLNVVSSPHVITAELDVTPVDSALWANLSEELRMAARRRVDGLVAELVPPSVECAIVLREGYPPDEIVTQVEDGGHDLVIMGVHGRTGLRGVMVGSVTKRVMRKSPVPVLVTR